MELHVPETVHIREVGPREGFQSVDEVISTEEKLEIIERFVASGCDDLNVASFVHPKITPQMADAEDVLHGLEDDPDVTYSALVPNQKGLERAIDVKAEGAALDKLIFLFSMTEAVLKANGVEKTPDEQFEELKDLLARANDEGFETLVGISAAWGCSLSGNVPQEDVVTRARQLKDIGADEIFLSDSTGQASPIQVQQLLTKLTDEVPTFPVTVHFHDSRGQAIANILAALQVRDEYVTYSAAFGGLGGDPPLEQSKGNVATEDLVCLLGGMGVDTGIDLDAYLDAVDYAAEQFETPFVSKVPTVGPSLAYRQNSPQ